jgi:hypothetical protein
MELPTPSPYDAEPWGSHDVEFFKAHRDDLMKGSVAAFSQEFIGRSQDTAMKLRYTSHPDDRIDLRP